MSAGEMSDGSPVTPELDARMLREIREWRRRLAPTSLGGNRWSARLTIDELDMLLRVAAERDALRRELVDMPDDHLAPVPVRSIPFTAEIPDEVRERAWVHSAHAARHGHPGEPCSDRSACYPGDRSTEPVHSGAVPENCVPRPKPTFTKTCARCNGRGGLPYEGPCSDCLGTGSTPA